MDTDPEQRAIADKLLEATKRKTGFIPVITQIQSTRPDIMIPMNRLGDAVLFKGDLDRKQKTLCAVSAAAAAGGEYCVQAQMREAIDAGATQDEVFEAIMIGSYMCMTRAQSYALRKYAEQFGIEVRNDRWRREPVARLNAVKRIYTALSLPLDDIMVSITPDAEKFINDLLEKNQRVGYGIKIYLSGFACSGPQFGMSFKEKPDENEIVDTSANGFDMYYDEETDKELKDCVIEFIDDPNFGTGLTIRNPNFNGCASCGGGCH